MQFTSFNFPSKLSCAHPSSQFAAGARAISESYLLESSMERTLTLLIATGATALALATSAQAGAAFSCDPAFEARAQSDSLDPELKTWIVDTARRFYQDRSRDFPAQMRAACAELGCVSEEDIVTKVARQCTRTPGQTLELAVQKSLRDIISPAISCDARCAMRLGAQ
jgi:hypothetical protein